MYEETDGGVGDVCAEELGYEQQVVVMHPDQVSWLVDVENCAREGSVCGFIRRPVRVGAEGG